MKLKHLAFICCLLFARAGYAQHDTLIYYLNKNGQYLQTKDSADIIREVIKPKGDEKIYTVHDSYPNGNNKLITHASLQNGNIFQGYCIEFYPNGAKKSNAFYENDIIRQITVYYPNGRLYISGDFNSQGLLIVGQCRDTTGNILASDGKGECLEYDDNFVHITDRGQISDGIKTGPWKHFINDTLRYTLQYEYGIATTGIGYDDAGSKYVFKEIEEPAMYKGGLEALAKFLTRNVHLTEDAIQHNVQGRVSVSFIIEKDGTMTDIKIVNGLGYGLDEQALNAVKKTAKFWTAAKQYGVPVRSLFTLPVAFYLSGDITIPAPQKPNVFPPRVIDFGKIATPPF